MQSDEYLLKKIKRKKDREAADILVGKYYKEIYAFSYRQTGDKEIAMDLTQDIFIAILQGINSYDEKRAQFRTWIYHIASNKITDYYRSRIHRNKTVECELNENLDTCSYEIMNKILNREMIRQVMGIIVGFDDEWIKIFQLKCFEEKTFKEIAKELKQSENTVKTRFYNMVQKVRKEVMIDER